MQTKTKIVKIFLVIFVVSLLLGACGGGTTGKTWFNLPSLAVKINQDGTGNVYGFSIGPVMQQSVIQQMQGADVQKLELRIGYNGIHVYINGEDLPYVSWDQESVTTLQELLPALPMVPNGAQIANYLPWLRKIGLGAVVYLPVAQGATALDISAWSGETAISPAAVGETTVGPMKIGAIVFDAEGNAIIEGIPLSTLEAITGSQLPLTLDANTLAILQAIGADSVRILLQPDGIHLFLNDEPLPGIAYDTEYLARTSAVASAFVTDPAQLAQLDQTLALLSGADIEIAVSFTGEPALETDLGVIAVNVAEDGTVAFGGLPLAEGAVPADTVKKLQEANIQQVALDVNDGGLFIASNGESLPTVTWTPESLATLTSAVAPMVDMPPEAIDEVLGAVLDTGIQVRVGFPPAEGEAPLEIPEDIDVAMSPPDLGETEPPFMRISATYDQTKLQRLGNLDAQEFAENGIVIPADLPPEVAVMLYGLGASEIKAATAPGQFNLVLDGQPALTLNYDVEALRRALALAAPFMEGSPLSDPGLSQLLDEQILPLVPGADFDVTISLQ